MSVDVERKQVLAYRIAAHGLDRATSSPADLAVFALGIQDTPAGSAQQAIAVRLRDVAEADGAARSAALVWSIRGAPHVHRRAGLAKLAAALWPLSDDDAIARLGGIGSHLRKVGVPGLTALTQTAEAFRASLTRSMTKGEASAAVTGRVSEELSPWCKGCKSSHISEQLFRLAALPAGARIEPGRAPLTFERITRWPAVPAEASGTASVVTSYLTLLGPATEADVAGFLGTKRPEILPTWPTDLTEVSVDGRRGWFPNDHVEALRSAERPTLVRLLPPYDPYLQARDRALLVPNKTHRSSLWRGLLGAPGAVLVDDEIAGVWRAKAGRKGQLELTIDAFSKVAAKTTKAIDDEAARVATTRSAGGVRVTYQSF
jgi:hypothetical protein